MGQRLKRKAFRTRLEVSAVMTKKQSCGQLTRWVLSLLIVCGLTSVAALVGSPTLALADNKTYALADWDTTGGGTSHAPQNQGGYADMYIAPGVANDWASGGHINQTLWVATDNSTTASQYWVEGGYSYGYRGSNILTYYWG